MRWQEGWVCLCVCGQVGMNKCICLYESTWVYIRWYTGRSMATPLSTCCTTVSVFFMIQLNSWSKIQQTPLSKAAYKRGTSLKLQCSQPGCHQVSSITFVIKWSTSCEPDLMAQHQWLTSLMLLWLHRSKSLQSDERILLYMESRLIQSHMDVMFRCSHALDHPVYRDFNFIFFILIF